MKSTLVIKDLLFDKELDRKTMAAVHGGNMPNTNTNTSTTKITNTNTNSAGEEEGGFQGGNSDNNPAASFFGSAYVNAARNFTDAFELSGSWW